MRAAVWYGPEQMKVEAVPDLNPGPDDMLLKIICCNICGSDIRTFSSGSSSIKEGTILGHEFVAEVIEAPSNSGFNAGDMVAAAQDIPCTTCWYCKNGMEHICENKLEFGKHFQGAFAEKMLIPDVALRQGWVKKIPAGMSINAASLIEPVSSCVHTRSVVKFNPGETILIIGAGPIGCMHGELAMHFGAEKVIMADKSESRLEVAKRFNFTNYVNPGMSSLEQMIKKDFPFGVDKVISANPSPKALAEAVGLVRKRGTVVAFGGLPKDNYLIQVDGNRVHYDEVSIIGSYAYSRAENDLALDYVQSGIISSEKYITATFSLDDITMGMHEARQATGMKVQISINKMEGF